MKFLFPIVFICFALNIFGQSETTKKVKYRKMDYTDFKGQFGINDTATVVIDIYFDKRDNGAAGQMLFFPITAGLFFIPPTSMIGAVTSLVSFPLFVHGGYTLVRFRKGKLYRVLDKYKTKKELPNWLRKKVNKRLVMYEVIEREY